MNSIATITKYLPYLDEVYKLASLTQPLETAGALVRDTADAKTVQVAKIAMDGLGNYSRAASQGFVDGDVTLTWESHTFQHDRGRSFQIDSMDDLETLGQAFAATIGQFVRTKVAPELDAVRFAKYYAASGTKVFANLSDNGAVPAIVTAENVLRNKEVDLLNTVLFVSPAVYQNVQLDTTHFARNITPGENPNSNFGTFDGIPVVVVPDTRFATGITLYDGSTDGQTDGGYVITTAQTTVNATGDGATTEFTVASTGKPFVLDSVTVGGAASTAWTYNAETGKITFDAAPANAAAIVIKYGKGRGINFALVDATSLIQITKHARARVFDPDTNQRADAYKVDYRIYHDAWVLENRAAGLYFHVKATV